MNVAAGRIANRLDFGGTNFTVDAACASSLAAIGLAVQRAAAGTSDMVLAGRRRRDPEPVRVTSASARPARCRRAAAAARSTPRADGIAISEGFATVVLKRLERRRARRRPHLRGDPRRRRRQRRPRPQPDRAASRGPDARAAARLRPGRVLARDGRAGRGARHRHGGRRRRRGEGADRRCSPSTAPSGRACAIGSVKSMIGHTKATAGVAGLIKAALALHHRVLPPTIGVTEPNPKANFPDSPFYVNTEARPWLAERRRDTPGEPASAPSASAAPTSTSCSRSTPAATSPTSRRRSSAGPAELLLWRGTPDEIADSRRVARGAAGGRRRAARWPTWR